MVSVRVLLVYSNHPTDNSLTDGSVSFAHSYSSDPFTKLSVECMWRFLACFIFLGCLIFAYTLTSCGHGWRCHERAHNNGLPDD